MNGLQLLNADRADNTLAEEVQEVTGRNVGVACVNQGYAGKRAVEAAVIDGIQLEVVKAADAKGCP